MKLLWMPAARRDRLQIYSFIEMDNPEAALRLDIEFAEAAQGLLEFSEKGRLGRKPGTREFIAHPNYILIYRTAEDAIEILRILHAARRWP